MDNELETVWKEAIVAYFKALLRDIPGAEETTISLGLRSQSQNRELNAGPPEYGPVVLPPNRHDSRCNLSLKDIPTYQSNNRTKLVIN
jgi:hypothetical protein